MLPEEFLVERLAKVLEKEEVLAEREKRERVFLAAMRASNKRIDGVDGGSVVRSWMNSLNAIITRLAMMLVRGAGLGGDCTLCLTQHRQIRPLIAWNTLDETIHIELPSLTRLLCITRGRAHVFTISKKHACKATPKRSRNLLRVECRWTDETDLLRAATVGCNAAATAFVEATFVGTLITDVAERGDIFTVVDEAVPLLPEGSSSITDRLMEHGRHDCGSGQGRCCISGRSVTAVERLRIRGSVNSCQRWL